MQVVVLEPIPILKLNSHILQVLIAFLRFTSLPILSWDEFHILKIWLTYGHAGVNH